MESDFTNSEKTLFTIKQNSKCEIPSVITVLLLPITMIAFANSKTGVFVGICLLFIILYGIYNIYKILYGKELLINTTKIVYKHFNTLKELSYEEIVDIKIKRSFLNTLCNTETFTLYLKNRDISLVNVNDTEKIKNYILNKKG